MRKLLPSILFFCLLALPAKSQSLIDIVEGSHQDVSLDVLCGPKQQKCQITFSDKELEIEGAESVPYSSILDFEHLHMFDHEIVDPYSQAKQSYGILFNVFISYTNNGEKSVALLSAIKRTTYEQLIANLFFRTSRF